MTRERDGVSDPVPPRAERPGGETSRKLGIVAGGGKLPRRVVDRCLSEGRPFFVFVIENAAEPGLFDDVPHMPIRLGAAGAYLKRAKEEGIQDLVMVGPVTRPSLPAMRPDATALKVLTRIGARALGDDGLLRAVIGYFEREHGWRIVGVDTLLTDMSPEPGQLGAHAPDAGALSDVARGQEVLAALAKADVGQAVVVQEGLVLGVEAIEGTDSLIARCAGLRREGAGGVLVKFAKQGQEMRADRPTLGPRTVEGARDAGLSGIAVEARRTLLVDRERMVEIADAAGMFLVAVDPSADA
ncbi:UDP-2,3-diacylglucosamine diphosphatase LpxI [Marivibrio halodurans]|uniref:UDP-2,3-diacylglucosamine diphosphatase LpxI n=1 Tax=Marivibrio halodurans TaxID=2039722 RepID=A0A8J7RVI1_9PROT|nr:UDP-2,3-diacylglucosamine diphosphatase LpxI [Marivibrio halodurans]